ncbi:lysylphosphatidylglycerol synthase domain-containing protein [Intrasporangium sp.]|uniref:lysylphosphatidylglycerol synthase domain-containing protein n=1 Tax=Intrasporangium sp. TaxID=1925024 RepID=UPI002939D357|nr:lysylphosphatidylglycerol synthase domain-containing protein [Intrasporangium sp.]MDV3221830.1 lysylphosphatidylglycerol synthase domain-containing protein [Intrasporangium sp.]
MTTQTLTPDLRPDLRSDVRGRVSADLGLQRPTTSRAAFSPRRALQVGVSLAVLVTLLVLVLPSVTGASWDSTTQALASVPLWQLAGLTGLWLIGLWAYSFVLAASLPGLTKGQGFILNLVGSGVSNLVPLGGAVGVGVTWAMARQYGFTNRAIGLFTAVTGVWNVLARLALPVAGLAGLLVVGAHVSGPVLVAAGLGAAVCALVVVLLVAALAHDGFATRLIAGIARAAESVAQLAGRSAPEGLAASLASQRASAVELLKRGRGGLVIGMLAYLVLQGVLMWACLAVVGSDLGWAEVTAAYACGRMLTTVVLTPGGTGFTETGTAAVLIALGGDPVVSVAGVLLFSFFTFACEIPGAAVAYLWHLRAQARRRGPRLTEIAAG